MSEIKHQRVRAIFLGRVEIRIDDRIETKFRYSQVPALLAYLILNPGSVSRSRIAGDIWPNRTEDAARHSLRETLVHLRKLLQGSPVEVLDVGRTSIGLYPGAVQSDLDPLVELRLTRSKGEDLMRLHQAVVDGYGGELLAGDDSEWLFEERMQLAHIFQNSLVEVARSKLVSAPEKALALAETAAQLEPFDESATACKLRALKGLGRSASAKAEFESYSNLLREELDLGPGRLVTEAYKQEPITPHENIQIYSSARHMVEFLKSQGQTEAAAELARSLVPYWLRSGLSSEGRRVLEEAYEAAGRGQTPEDLLSLAELSQGSGDIESAFALGEQVLKRNPAFETRIRAQLLLARGAVIRFRFRYARRLSLLAARDCRRHGNNEYLCKAWLEIGLCGHYLHSGPKVLTRAKRTERLARRLGREEDLSTAQILVAQAEANNGNTDAAAEIARETLRRLIPVPSIYYCNDLIQAAHILDDLGFEEEAILGYREGAEACSRFSKRGGEEIARTYLAESEYYRGQYEAALQIHLSVLESRRTRAAPNLALATSLRGVGMCLTKLKRFEEAKPILKESVERYRDEGSLVEEAAVLLLLAEIEAAIGSRSLARNQATNALKMIQRLSRHELQQLGRLGNSLQSEAESLIRDLQHDAGKILR